MVKVFNIYKDNEKIRDAVFSPVVITGLTPETVYPKGTYSVSAVIDGIESKKYEIPEFTTLPTIIDVGPNDNPLKAYVSETRSEPITAEVTIVEISGISRDFTAELTKQDIVTLTKEGQAVILTPKKVGTDSLLINTIPPLYGKRIDIVVEEYIDVTGIEITSPKELTVANGESFTVTHKVLPANATNTSVKYDYDRTALTWGANGKFTPTKTGDYTIKIISNETNTILDTMTVHVQ